MVKSRKVVEEIVAELERRIGDPALATPEHITAAIRDVTAKVSKGPTAADLDPKSVVAVTNVIVEGRRMKVWTVRLDKYMQQLYRAQFASAAAPADVRGELYTNTRKDAIAAHKKLVYKVKKGEVQ